MAKNKEYTERGIREFYSVKGCNSCTECKFFHQGYGNFCKCLSLIGKNSSLDRRFPYDNTRCKNFQAQSTEG